MGDDITIGVTEIVNNIEVTAQPSDQVIEIDVVDNSDDVTLNITPTVIEININKGSSFARWGTILGNLPDQADLQNVLNLKADLVGGLVPASQLPSYVDDIVEVANYAALPVVGETGKIYLTLDNNKIFRWSGSVYIEVAANNAIWGAITGTLSSQTDLQTALDTKALKTITITPNAPLSGGGDLSANRTISISQSNATTDGYLSSTDWDTFNGKADDSLVVHKAGSETITGIKTFTGSSTIFDYTGASRLVFKADGTDTAEFSFGSTFTQITSKASDGYLFKNSAGSNSLTISNAGAGTFLSSLTATSFIKTGGTSNQYLKADGSVSTLTNPITGTGTLNYIPKFTASGTIGNSNILDNGSYIDILSGAFIAGNLNVNGVVSSGTPSNTLSILSGSGAIFVKNSASNTAYAFQLNTSSGLDLWSTNSGGTSTRRLTLDSSGNVGIGTTSPNFSSSGRTVTDINGTSQSMLALSVGGVGKGFLFHTGTDLLVSNEGNGAIKLNTNGSQKVVIEAGGNVGIGTTSPSRLLSLGGTAYIDVVLKSTSASGVAGGGTLYFNNSSTDSSGILNYDHGGNFMNFFTVGSERMRITSGGNVGIGTTSPSVKLHTVGSSEVFRLGTTNSLNYFTFFNSSGTQIGDIGYDGRDTDILSIWNNSNGGMLFGTNGTEKMRITSGGNVGIGNGFTPSYTLHVNGSVAGTSAYVNLSDKRYKKDILPIENALDKILALNGVTFNWNKESTDMNLDDNNHIGLIAQDVEEVLPQAVVTSTDENETKSVAYTDLVPVLIEAVKELKAEIEILKNK